MKITDKYEMSMWAYFECKKRNSDEIKSIITDPVWIYLYCTYICYDESMWNKIKQYLLVNTKEINPDLCLRDIWKNMDKLKEIRGIL